MTFNKELTSRVREALSNVPGLEEKRMVGGVAFLVNGKMCVSVKDERVMCRVDPTMVGELTRRRGCRTMTMNGREYRGYIFVDEKVLGTRSALGYWLRLAIDFNERAGVARKA
jgi:TfoX/Sxy family transcriptional regulator of competence genes